MLKKDVKRISQVCKNLFDGFSSVKNLVKYFSASRSRSMLQNLYFYPSINIMNTIDKSRKQKCGTAAAGTGTDLIVLSPCPASS